MDGYTAFEFIVFSYIFSVSVLCKVCDSIIYVNFFLFFSFICQFSKAVFDFILYLLYFHAFHSSLTSPLFNTLPLSSFFSFFTFIFIAYYFLYLNCHTLFLSHSYILSVCLFICLLSVCLSHTSYIVSPIQESLSGLDLAG